MCFSERSDRMSSFYYPCEESIKIDGREGVRFIETDSGMERKRYKADQ